MPDIKIKAAFNRAEQENTVVESEAIAAALLLDTPETVQIATVTLTAAQIKALNTTPVSLIAAPGSGKVIIIERLMAESIGVVAAFTGANALEFKYAGTATKVTADIPSTFINAVVGTPQYRTVGGVEDVVTPANTAVTVSVPVANPGGATAAGTIRFTIAYRVFS
jgi:hypothetical protein